MNKEIEKIKTYFDVLFDDGTGTIVSRPCITNALPAKLRMFKGKEGEEIQVAQYELTEAVNSLTKDEDKTNP